jgi:hypothetical protein
MESLKALPAVAPNNSTTKEGDATFRKSHRTLML